MQALRVLSEVQHRNVTLWAAGDRLRFSPATALTPELIDGLRENKEFFLRMLERRNLPPDPRPRIGNVGEVLELARNVLPELKEEDRVDLDELIQANSPPPPGRDPLVKRGTDKARFFSEDWREAGPTDWTPYRPEGAA
jgi:hypothetical protein